MKKQIYITRMPDKPGAFMLASKIIMNNNGNIVRVSYNKAIDVRTLFIDVAAEQENLDKITKELSSIGYLSDTLENTQVIVIDIKIKDEPGGVYPVLKILEQYDVNISYINSYENETPYQSFKMGLLIENPDIIKLILNDISELYQVDIINYNNLENTLDNTIFYIRLGNEIQRMLGLSMGKAKEFISEANRTLQMLQDKGENPEKVFDYVKRFAQFVSSHKGDNFVADISKHQINADITLHIIEPPCGSNTYIFELKDELVFIDTGFAIYAEEMFKIFHSLFNDFENRKKKIIITHADVDHCGLLSVMNDAEIYLNEKSADSLNRQLKGELDYREQNNFCVGYSKLSRIITNYQPPVSDKFHIIGNDVPKQHKNLLLIDTLKFNDLELEVYEGSGGHLYGEMVFLCRKHRVAFTGDIYVNIEGFSEERAEFNSLAPYLMTSVNTNSEDAKNMRNAVCELIDDAGRNGFYVYGGHGDVRILK
ncbi:MAG: MBL fold metallo-hydrolase [Bacillota bacterium]|nr:MBL fold metallo-hydrolase [Bacillota bacterium]